MTPALGLVTIGLFLGSVGPRLLRQQTWMTATPRLGVAMWLACVWSSVFSFTTGVILLSMDNWLVRDAVADLLQMCLTTFHHHYGTHPMISLTALALMTAATAALLCRVAQVLVRSWMLGRRHHRDLDALAVPHAERRVAVIRHQTPTAYCLPGRGGRIVLSSGALNTLSPAQLDAVIAHERAHLAGGHHKILAFLRATRAALPFLWITRSAPVHIRPLLERLADDGACRNHDPQVLATALLLMSSTAPAPASALEISGAPSPMRLRYLRGRDLGLAWPGRVCAWATAIAVALAPVALAITPALGMGTLTDHCDLPAAEASFHPLQAGESGTHTWDHVSHAGVIRRR